MSIAARTPSRLAGPARRIRTPVVAAAIGLVWLVLGLAGLGAYLNHYRLYRGFPPPQTPAGIPRGTVHEMRLWSPALHESRAAMVYLPPGYAAAAAHGRRFPVLYLLHGHPGRPLDMFRAGSLAPFANVLLAEHRIRPMIIVAPWGRSHNHADSNEWANGRYGNYEGFVLDLVRAVDHRYATIPRRQDRAIGGDSEGAYGAANLTLRHLGVFGGFESWSGYFRETPVGAFAGATPQAIYANSPADYVRTLAPRIRRMGLHAYVYVGSSDHHGRPLARQFGAELVAAGADAHTAVFPGGHDWGLWRAQLPHMLKLASQWFAGGRA